jgi:hypothetical protein
MGFRKLGGRSSNSLPGEYVATMYEKSSFFIYKTQAHYPCWLHISRIRLMDSSGKILKLKF